ncbi:HTH-type transcriptional activator Btr [Kordia antarctica]|uniref:HTH-type transcriptional activator Btr n=1 Tax=Kordia antarctica TaxID=1218801 RepID=A0A7L4ZL80_9FLAO|nr:helix-turn-helix transcriptional regulator [Kordia antarctica]QHI37372.1 HTH-type transcriptional activator Btr [Kordia antarctica]
MFKDLNVNIYNLLIFAGIIQGIIFGIIVLTNKKYNNKASFSLACVMLLMSLSNLQYWLIDTKTIEKYTFIKFTYIPWHWLIMPFFYLFVYKYLQRKEKLDKKIKLYLFAPFFIVLSIVIVQLIYKFLINPNYELPSHFSRGIFIYLDILSILFIVSIIYMIFKMLKKYEIDNKEYDSLQVISETAWLKRLITIGLITCVFWIVAMAITVYSNEENLALFYFLWLGMSIIIYYLGYVGINKLQLIKERKKIRVTQTAKKIKKNLHDNKLDEIFENFTSIVSEKYTNPNLTLEEISKELNISSSYLSQKIKANSGENFSTYINALRIKKAKKMLINSEYKNYTTTAIGLEAGFNSKSSFYRAFKKNENCTPQQYINSQK